MKTISEAARVAHDGATVEVDAGVYRGDTAVWWQRDLTLLAVGGRVRLVAVGAAAEGKAIWVVRGDNVKVQGFDFEGARVPSRNGAGIRLERGSLLVRDCTFVHNEMGLLTNNDGETVLEIENSEFAYNQREDGHNHNLYAGSIARLSVIGSYFHHARHGHLLKSRARVNRILYNRLTDETGSASYELEFPNGGIAYVIGNLIQQGAGTENPQLVSYGAEGYRRGDNALYVVANTLVDDLLSGGVFLRVYPGAGAVRVVDNVFVGNAGIEAGTAELAGNVHVERSAFADAAHYDYQLRPGASTTAAIDPGTADGLPLRPTREYSHPHTSVLLQTPASRPGAFQRQANDR